MRYKTNGSLQFLFFELASVKSCKMNFWAGFLYEN